MTPGGRRCAPGQADHRGGGPARRDQEAADRPGAAGVVVRDRGGIGRHDRRCGAPVARTGGRVVVVVAEIAAHDDERLGTAPDPIEHRRDLAGARVPDGERKERECAEDALEERQLDLERMLAGMRAIVDRDARQLEDAPSERIVDGHGAERGDERVGAAHGEAVDRYAVRGPERHDVPDASGERTEPRVRAARDRP